MSIILFFALGGEYKNMRTYHSITELGGRCLEFNDEVIFNYKDRRYVYRVGSCSLHNVNGNIHDLIFKNLSLNKNEYCKIHYGYKAEQGIWPECKFNDYAALTRLVTDLYAKIHMLEKYFNKTTGQLLEEEQKAYVSTKMTKISENNPFNIKSERNSFMAYGSAGAGKSQSGINKYLDNILLSEVQNSIRKQDLDKAIGGLASVNISPNHYGVSLLTKSYEDYYKDSYKSEVLITKDIIDKTINKEKTKVKNKSNKNQKINGNSINVSAKTATITRGQRKQGNTISGKRCSAAITVGYLRNRKIAVS